MKHIRTLEDLEKFPKLEVIVNHGIRDYETEEGEEQFEESFKPTQQEYERYQKMLKKTLPKLKNLKEVSFGSRTIFYDLDAFAECTQIEKGVTVLEEQEGGEGFVETLEELGIERLGYKAIKDMNKEAERMKEKHE